MLIEPGCYRAAFANQNELMRLVKISAKLRTSYSFRIHRGEGFRVSLMQGAKNVQTWLLDDVPSLKKLQTQHPHAYPRDFTVTVCRKDGDNVSDTFHSLSEAIEFLQKTEHKIDFFEVSDDANENGLLALRAGYWVRHLPDGELTDLGDCVKETALSILDQLDSIERFNWTNDKIEFQLFQKTGECSL